MSTQQDTVTAIYEALGRGDLQAILRHLSPEVRWEDWEENSAQKAGVPWIQARHGREDVLGYFRLLSTFGIDDFRVVSLFENGSQVAAEIVVELDVPETGAHFRDEEMHVWTFDDDGRISGFRHYVDTAKQIAAARLETAFYPVGV